MDWENRLIGVVLVEAPAGTKVDSALRPGGRMYRGTGRPNCLSYGLLGRAGRQVSSKGITGNHY